MSSLGRLFASALILLFTTAAASARETAELNGRVTDESAAVQTGLPGRGVPGGVFMSVGGGLVNGVAYTGPVTVYIAFGAFGTMDPGINSPRSQSWNVTVEQQLGANWGMAVSYLGHFNWGDPVVNLNSGQFGRITTLAGAAAGTTVDGRSGGPRIMQFGIKYDF